MRKILQDKTQNALLSRRGFVHHRLLEADQIQELLDNARHFYPEESLKPMMDGSGNSYIMNSYTNGSISCRQFAAKRIKSMLQPYVEQLFERYRIISCGLFIKVPGAGWLDLHYHPTVVDDPKHWVVDIWCPLVDANLINGTLCVVPESHKIFPQTIGHPSSGTMFCKDYMSIVREDYSIALPSRAGDAVFFENSLLHWSPVNQSDSPRFALHCSCIPLEATAVHTHFDPSQAHKFDLYRATDDYFDEVFGSFLARPDELEFLKTLPNLNRLYSPAEFKARLSNAAEIRHNLLPDSQFVPDSVYQELLKQESELDAQFQAVPVPKKFAVAPSARLKSDHQPSDQAMSSEKSIANGSMLFTRLNSLARRVRRTIAFLDGSSKPFAGHIQRVKRDARQTINQYSTSDVKQYYDEMTPSYIKGFGEVFQGARPESTDELVSYLIDAAKLEDGQRILDAGCGICGPAIMFAERCDLAIEALTLSLVQVSEAKKRISEKGLEPKINVRQGDFHRLAEIYPANTFDRVLFLESLCHAEDYRKVLTQVKHVLKPGGLLYIKDFYAIDHRSKPELLALQVRDLKALNEIYRLVMPDLPSTVDLISELGYIIHFMRKPQWNHSLLAWQNFMHYTNQFWIRESGDAIQAAEFLAQKPFE